MKVEWASFVSKTMSCGTGPSSAVIDFESSKYRGLWLRWGILPHHSFDYFGSVGERELHPLKKHLEWPQAGCCTLNLFAMVGEDNP
jgi:hypothetical protein